MDILQSGGEWLERARADVCVQVVTLRRASGGAREIRVTPIRHESESLDAEGFPLTGRRLDFLVAASEMDAPPRSGDKIEWGERRYEIAPTGGGEAWEWSTPYRHAYLVHAREVGSEWQTATCV